MLSTKYDHLSVEEGKYENWKRKEYFKSGDLTKKPFCIVIPPPNVTGKLHLGHAWDTGIQDVIIRYKRMQGYDTLWLPGMDHAGIATQAKIDKKLKSEGIKPREMKRDDWLKVAWEWKHEYAANIHEQWAKLGLSLDYSKERFTLDEGLSDAVKHVFVTLYNKGLIYRGERIINWDPEAMTALSNEEVIYKETKGAFYYLKYFLEDSNEYLVVATTRPETLFGDTAVAVNPDDERYKHFIGKNVILPIINKKIPVIADNHADPEFGTGVVKITPAHDPNDFEVGNRHNLERIVVINPNGVMNENAGIYNGLDRFECRKKLIEDLKEKDILVKIEEITHNVGYSERTDVMIEPYLSKQWFVKMRPLADRVLENQKNKDTKVNFVPKRFEKIMNHWMEITYDWCISRQLWWGHRIPAWYKGDEVYVGVTKPEGEGWIQDEDVLDTWFSSALWPFSTLGFPEKTKDLERYYPNDVLVTGYDIIPFWVNRMTFQGLEFTNQRPFKECLIHGLIRDKEGRKMSKSLGNGIDPMDVIKEYGNDSLRYFLTTSTSSGSDLRYDEDKVKSTWNFINKLWNASRFCLLNMEDFKEIDYKLENLKKEDKWIISKLNKVIKDVIKYMDKYEFNNVASILYSFIWDDFCDTYIEFAKFSLNENATKSTLYYVIINILKMLHPFMPYVTDEIYDKLPFTDAENIMISNYPTYNKKLINEESELEVERIIDFIKVFRNIKQENNISKDFKVKLISNLDDLIIKMLKLTDNITNEELNITKYHITNNHYSLDLYYQKVLTEEDIKLKEKQIETLKSNISRREKLLSNEGYVNKAPKELVMSEKVKLEDEKKLLEKLLNE
ncbi:MAG: valine--tRNA ligase [Bacilli bacterium]|nr:valine--tRNA ligase [Bacilli bacterium]